MDYNSFLKEFEEIEKEENKKKLKKYSPEELKKLEMELKKEVDSELENIQLSENYNENSIELLKNQTLKNEKPILKLETDVGYDDIGFNLKSNKSFEDKVREKFNLRKK